jgi:hypothetical protein
MHTLALDAPPLHFGAFRVWASAASQDGAADGGALGVALGDALGGALGSPVGSSVGGAYLRAALEGEPGPPLHVWLCASEGPRGAGLAAHRIAGRRGAFWPRVLVVRLGRATRRWPRTFQKVPSLSHPKPCNHYVGNPRPPPRNGRA